MKSTVRFWLPFVGVIALASLTAYQNCAPSNSGGSSFILGSTAPLTISSIQISQSQFQPGASITASAPVVSSVTVTCQWLILTSTNTFISNTTTAAINNICHFSGTAPTTQGTYNLQLVAVTASNQTAEQKVTFNVTSAAATATPTATPPPALTPTPPPPPPTATPTPPSCYGSGYNCNNCTNSQCTGPNICNQCCGGSYFNEQHPYSSLTIDTYYCN